MADDSTVREMEWRGMEGRRDATGLGIICGSRSEVKYSIDQRQSGNSDHQFILAGVMQMIEILDNQSGAGPQLLKTRHHSARRICCAIETVRVSRL